MTAEVMSVLRENAQLRVPMLNVHVLLLYFCTVRVSLFLSIIKASLCLSGHLFSGPMLNVPVLLFVRVFCFCLS